MQTVELHATGEKRTPLWERITRRYANYASYQRSTEREIPVVVCEPAGATDLNRASG